MGRTLQASSKSSSEGRELIPAGTYRAVVLGYAEIGSHEGLYGLKSQAIITWEVWKKGQPVGQISNFYTCSFDVKANLRRDVEAMLGRTFSDGDSFDPEDLLQQTCRIQVVEKAKKDGTARDAIGSIMAADEEDAAIIPKSPVFFFQLPEQPEKCPIPDEVPEWIARKIQESQEWLGQRARTPQEPARPEQHTSRRATPEEMGQRQPAAAPAVPAQRKPVPAGKASPPLPHTGDDDIPY
jgi:hypothetical protein